jgi:hypothetical protein
MNNRVEEKMILSFVTWVDLKKSGLVVMVECE